ncbi:MAG: hypothetical protein Q9191_002055 [Dirinaria sp. TL-2023a]
MASSIDLSIYADTSEIVDLDNVPVDQTLSDCIVSKALVDHLRPDGQYNPIQPVTIRDSDNRLHSVIGNVDLKWRKKDTYKTRHQKFSVVNSSAEFVRMDKNALPKAKEADIIDTLGLQKQTDEQKLQQEKKRQEEQAKRAKEKEEQAEKEKKKQTSNNTRK